MTRNTCRKELQVRPIEPKNVSIPTHWNGQQADGILRFLNELSLVIWETYQDTMVQDMRRQRLKRESCEADPHELTPTNDG